MLIPEVQYCSCGQLLRRGTYCGQAIHGTLIQVDLTLSPGCSWTHLVVISPYLYADLEKKKKTLEESSHSFLTSGVMAIIYREKSVLVTKSCLILCDPMDCSLSDSSVHGILQAKILEWVAISFSRRSSWPRDWTQASCIAGGFFNQLSHRGSPLYMAEKPNGNFQNYQSFPQ